MMVAVRDQTTLPHYAEKLACYLHSASSAPSTDIAFHPSATPHLVDYICSINFSVPRMPGRITFAAGQ